MTLPKIDLPIHTIKIPSSGQEIQVRPFVVKEEKLLLMAAQSKDPIDVVDTTQQIINNCIITDGVDVHKMPFFDVDYIFIALRAKSLGESIIVPYICNHSLEDGSICGGKFDVKVDISNTSIIKDPKLSLDINLSGGIRLKLKYPTYSTMKMMENHDNNELDLDKKVKIIAHSVDQVIEKDRIQTNKDFTPDEMIEFISGLTQEDFKKLEFFVEHLPTFVIDSESTCSRCGQPHKIKYDDFTSFFF